MKTHVRSISFLLVILFAGIDSNAQETAPPPKLKPVVITIGKRNQLFIGKNALIEARKLSAFYFEKNGLNPAEYKVTRYTVSIIQNDSRNPDLLLDCFTDVFPDKVFDALKVASPGTTITFSSIKASMTNPKDKSIGLMPDMKLTLTKDD